MRFYNKKCTYCKTKREQCEAFKSQRELLKNLKNNYIKSISINCSSFMPIAQKGDIIEFSMNGKMFKKMVWSVSNNHRTYIILTANNQKNRELFTRTKWDNNNETIFRYFDYLSEEDIEQGVPANLMFAFVNYKYIKRVARKAKNNFKKKKKNETNLIVNLWKKV